MTKIIKIGIDLIFMTLLYIVLDVCHKLIGFEDTLIIMFILLFKLVMDLKLELIKKRVGIRR